MLPESGSLYRSEDSEWPERTVLTGRQIILQNSKGDDWTEWPRDGITIVSWKGEPISETKRAWKGACKRPKCRTCTSTISDVRQSGT